MTKKIFFNINAIFFKNKCYILFIFMITNYISLLEIYHK